MVSYKSIGFYHPIQGAPLKENEEKGLKASRTSEWLPKKKKNLESLYR